MLVKQGLRGRRLGTIESLQSEVEVCSRSVIGHLTPRSGNSLLLMLA
jgi:hypothetical protein